MISVFLNLPNYVQAFIAGVFTFLITSLGSALVLFFKNPSEKLEAIMLAVSGGIMLAASFFSLLAPSIEQAENLGLCAPLTALLGLLLGGLFLFYGDKILSFFIKGKNQSKRTALLVGSIVLHNIPEGLAIGVAFGSIAYGLEGATVLSAVMLAIGIGIQNFPEGTAISLPLRGAGFSRKKSFIVGMLSGIVEPFSALLGALLVLKVRFVLPYLLAFAAGAMIYVVYAEIIPESHKLNNSRLVALLGIIGFAIMMVLDVALG